MVIVLTLLLGRVYKAVMAQHLVQDGRIIFAEGTKTKEIKHLCGECLLNTSCLGPDSKGFADFVLPRGVKSANETISAAASCLRERETA